MVRYLAAAERTGDWLLATAQQSQQGWFWPIQPWVCAEVWPGDLAFAVTLVDDILDRAILDTEGMCWSNYEFRLPQPDLPAETSYMQGAPGIGSTLLRLHRHLAGDPWTVRWPHAPTWTSPR